MGELFGFECGVIHINLFRIYRCACLFLYYCIHSIIFLT